MTSELIIWPFSIILLRRYFYPRKTVTSHFWSENQRVTFTREEIQERAKHHQPLLKYVTGVSITPHRSGLLFIPELISFSSKLIECRSQTIPDHLLMDWRQLLQELQRGKRPSTHEILKYSKLFHRSGPYYLQNLPNTHIVSAHTKYLSHSMFFYFNPNLILGAFKRSFRHITNIFTIKESSLVCQF